MPRKRILSICRTCREPLPDYKFRRHADELRSRHDSCIACEDATAKTKALNAALLTQRTGGYPAKMAMSTLAERAKGTAFEILYAVKAPPPPLTKAEIARERGRLNSARANALRAAKKKAAHDNKQKANWTI